MSIGYVNGAQVNYLMVDGAGGEQINFGLLERFQDNQTQASAASNAVVSASATVQPDNALTAMANASVASILTKNQASEQSLSAGQSAICVGVSIVELNDLLDSIFHSFVDRKPLGSNLTPHTVGGSVTPHSGGTHLTVH